MIALLNEIQHVLDCQSFERYTGLCWDKKYKVRNKGAYGKVREMEPLPEIKTHKVDYPLVVGRHPQRCPMSLTFFSLLQMIHKSDLRRCREIEKR